VRCGRDRAANGVQIAAPEALFWGGPIVMNTRAELRTGFEEYEKGTFLKHARP
jgi:hypothetical protein